MKNKVIICAAVVMAFVLATIVVVKQRSAEPEPAVEVQEPQNLLAELPMENASAPELEQLIYANEEAVYTLVAMSLEWDRGAALYFADGNSLSPIAELSYDQEGQLTASRDESSVPWEDNIYLLLANGGDYEADYFTFALADGIPQNSTGVKTTVPGKSYVLAKLDLDFTQLPPQQNQYFDVLTVFQETVQQGLDIYEYYNSLNLRYQVDTGAYTGTRLPEQVITTEAQALQEVWDAPYFQGDGVEKTVISATGGTIRARAQGDGSGSFGMYVFADGSIVSSSFWAGDKQEFSVDIDRELLQDAQNAGILVMSMFCPWNNKCTMDGSQVYSIER